jgi:hypothetical protein
MVVTSAPVAYNRFTRASSFPPASNLHAFQVSSFIDGKFIDCQLLIFLRMLPGSSRTLLTSPGSLGTSGRTWGVSWQTWGTSAGRWENIPNKILH